MHAGESKGGVEFWHDSGKLDDVLDARLAGLFDEVRLHLEHSWIRGRDEHSTLHSSQWCAPGHVHVPPLPRGDVLTRFRSVRWHLSLVSFSVSFSVCGI